MAAILSSRPGPLSGRSTQTPTRLDVEGGERVDQPAFKPFDEAAHVAAALAQVEHHIGHPLAGAVIGILPAAPGVVDREAAGRQQVLRRRRGAGGIKRRVLEQPHGLVGDASGDGCGPRLHRRQSLGIGDQPVGDDPVHRPPVGAPQLFVAGAGRGGGR
jgi:hypothetical protein